MVRTPGTRRPDIVLVCEGIPDALTAAQVGYRAVGVLGAGVPDDQLCHRLLDRFPSEHLVVGFDKDDTGRTGVDRLSSLLDAAGARERSSVLDVPSRWGDL